MKHGAFEKLAHDALFEDEIRLMEEFAYDPIELLKEQIIMLRIKEKRIARKMKDALEAEKNAGKDDGNGKKHPVATLLTISTVQEQTGEGSAKKIVTSNSETWQMHYLRLENAHTRLLDELRRAMNNLASLELKCQIEDQKDAESGVLLSPGMMADDAWEKLASQK